MVTLPNGCQACPADTYKNRTSSGAASAVCVSCPAHSSSVGSLGLVSWNQCQCLPGFQDNGGLVCVPCAADTYNPTSGSSCLPCQASASTNGLSGSSQAAACQCKAGFFGTGAQNDCVPCPTGSFKTAYGDLPSCTSCPAGSTTSGTGSTSVAACACVAGLSGDPAQGIDCTACPIDTYKNLAGSSGCVPCPGPFGHQRIDWQLLYCGMYLSAREHRIKWKLLAV